MIYILTCKLGKNIINCYDGEYSKEQLKKWASKKILICPVCNKPYEYCHGVVKTPYFRHMDKNECEDIYSESETEEHLNGKRDLYEWIKNQDGVTNAILEGWIPETKQRPDIMFKYNGVQYVIEYQCTPIASEYEERHSLYKAIGVTDIWICGTKKYLESNMRKKYLEDKSCGFYDTNSKEIYCSKNTNNFNLSKLGMLIFDYKFRVDDIKDLYDYSVYGIKIDKLCFDKINAFKFKYIKDDLNTIWKKIELRKNNRYKKDGILDFKYKIINKKYSNIILKSKDSFEYYGDIKSNIYFNLKNNTLFLQRILVERLNTYNTVSKSFKFKYYKNKFNYLSINIYIDGLCFTIDNFQILNKDLRELLNNNNLEILLQNHINNFLIDLRYGLITKKKQCIEYRLMELRKKGE